MKPRYALLLNIFQSMLLFAFCFCVSEAEGSNSPVNAPFHAETTWKVSENFIAPTANPRHAPITWEESSIRRWLNNEFLKSAFTRSEQALIHSINSLNKNNQEYGTYGGNITNDKVFLLSLEEANFYFGENKNGVSWLTPYGRAHGVNVNQEGPDSWWLRSPGKYENFVATVSWSGDINYYGGYVGEEDGVRPALVLDTTKVKIETDDGMNELRVGDLLNFGTYEQDNNYANGTEPISWFVLGVKGDMALLLSENCLEWMEYDQGHPY